MASPGGHRVPRLLLGFLVAAAAAEPGAAPPPGQVCGEGCCAGPAPEGSAVAAFCGNRTGAELRGRCCVDGATEQEAVVVVGLDLGNCSLTTLCSGFQEARTAVIIDLTGNPLRDLPEDAFRGFTQLQTLLAVPRGLPVHPGRARLVPVPVHEPVPRLQVPAPGLLPLSAVSGDSRRRHSHPLHPALGHPAAQSQDLVGAAKGGRRRRRAVSPLCGRFGLPDW
uniref:All-trans retinoic acid-induced differentiation factor isoform X3 n=1 Tax=Pogona vitticeps TaxID=103695 RepID=A0ABM5F868_9SAUR